jgi:hypothetical protein
LWHLSCEIIPVKSLGECQVQCLIKVNYYYLALSLLPIRCSINFPLLPSPGDSRARRLLCLDGEHPISQSPEWRLKTGMALPSLRGSNVQNPHLCPAPSLPCPNNLPPSCPPVTITQTGGEPAPPSPLLLPPSLPLPVVLSFRAQVCFSLLITDPWQTRLPSSLSVEDTQSGAELSSS